ncbi:BMC domain-containing protein, partial [Synechococcus sp. H60.3]
MAIAVGMIETLGFPAVVEAADAMVKLTHIHILHIPRL